MYNKRTRFWCYAFTLLPALIGLILWGTSAAFPAAMLLTPLFLALTLRLCLYLTEKLETDREKNRKINNVVIWIIPVLSNVTFWITYALIFKKLDVPLCRILGCFFGILFLVLGNYLPKCRQNSVVGFRVKWTASTEENWNATHRLAGPCYMVCGFLMILSGFLPETAALICLFALLVVSSVIPLVYSYLYYKKQQRQGVTFQPRPKWEKNVSRAALGFLAVVLLAVAVLLFTGSVKMRFDDSAMQVDVTYYGSERISYASLESVELRDENVPGSRIWGIGSLRLLAGLFENAEFGDYTRLTYYNPQSTIVLKTTAGRIYVLSGKNAAETQTIYEEILTHLG